MSTRTKTALERLAAQRFPSDEMLGPVPPIERLSWWPERSQPVSVTTPTTAATSLATAPSPWRWPQWPAATGLRPSSPLRRRTLLASGLAAGAFMTAVAVPYLMRGDSAAYAATPKMLSFTTTPEPGSAQEVLTGLAAHALSRPRAGGTGPYHYIHTRGWYLHTALGTDGRIRESGIRETDREQWVAEDGSGRLAVTHDGKQLRPPTGTYRPGGLTGHFLAGDSPEAVRAALVAQNPTGTAASWFITLSDLWKRQVVPPVLHGVLLDILATQPGVSITGTTVDRAGRRGIAVSTEDHRASAKRLVLVLSEDNGDLLDFEEIALEPGGLPIRAPATVGYTLWLTTGYTSTTEQHP